MVAEVSDNSEQQSLFKIVSESPIPMMLHAQDGKICALSKAWTDLSGYEKSSLKSIHDWTSRAYVKNAPSAESHFELNEPLSVGELKIKTADGEVRTWVLSSGPAGSLVDGTKLFVSVAHDVTAEKRAADYLSKQKALLESIFTDQPIRKVLTDLCLDYEAEFPEGHCSVLLLDRSGKCLRHGAAPSMPTAYNEAVDGVEIGPSVGSCGTAVFYGKPVVVEDISIDSRWENFRELAAANGLAACWSMPILATNGEPIGSFAVYYDVPRGPSDDELRMLGSASNLASRVIENHRARTEVEELKIALQVAGLAVARLDEYGVYYQVDQNYSKLLGYDDQELLGKTWEIAIFPEDTPLVRAAFRDVKEFGRGFAEVRAQRKDGSRFFKSLSLVKARGEFGENAGHWCFMRDISERKSSEEMLRRAVVDAKQAAIAKNQYLEKACYEIRAPLNGIVGASALLDKVGRDNLPFVEIIDSCAARLSSLMDDVVDFSKLENGQLPISKNRFSISRMLEKLTSRFEEVSRHPGAKLKLEVSPDVPQEFEADEFRVSQIFRNLIAHAANTSLGDGEVLLAVSVEGSGKRAGLRFSISNKMGCVSADELEKIFEPFYGHEKATSRLGGKLGLSLALTKRLVEALGGEISATGTSSGGAEYCFYLPGPVDNTASLFKDDDSEELDGTGIAVLLAEDDPASERLLTVFLERFGFDVCSATDGEEVIALYSKRHFDIVLMDVRMPIMDGLESARRIRGYEEAHGCDSVPIVGITAQAMIGDRERCLVVGMDRYLTKPLDLLAFKAVLIDLVQTIKAKH